MGRKKKRISSKILNRNHKGQKRAFNKDELRNILFTSVYKHRQFCLLVLLGCCTGLRVNELVNVTKKDLQDKSFTYYSSKQRKYIHKQVLPIFYIWFKELGFKFCDLDKYLFIGARSKQPLKQDYIAKLLKYYCKKIGLTTNDIKNISTHTLRRTYAKLIIDDLGESLSTLHKIKELFQHSTIDTTIRYLGYQSKFKSDELNNVWF